MPAKQKTVTKKPKAVKGAKQKTKIDWVAARHYYLGDATVSYADISKKFGVASTTVEKRGKAEGWVQLRNEIGEKAFEKFTDNAAEEKSSAQTRHMQHWQNVQALANKAIMEMHKKGNIKVGKLESLARTLKISIEGERIVLGLPNNVTAVTDKDGESVWDGFAEMVKAAEEVIANDSATAGGAKKAS